MGLAKKVRKGAQLVTTLRRGFIALKIFKVGFFFISSIQYSSLFTKNPQIPGAKCEISSYQKCLLPGDVVILGNDRKFCGSEVLTPCHFIIRAVLDMKIQKSPLFWCDNAGVPGFWTIAIWWFYTFYTRIYGYYLAHICCNIHDLMVILLQNMFQHVFNQYIELYGY